MSAASERARALLAAVKARGFGTGSLDGYDGWKLLADACSIEGGLLAALAGEVEAHEAGIASVLDEKARQIVWYEDGVARLRKALEEARPHHTRPCSYLEWINVYGDCWEPGDFPDEATCDRLRRCTCGADANNARIDAALKGEG